MLKVCEAAHPNILLRRREKKRVGASVITKLNFLPLLSCRKKRSSLARLCDGNPRLSDAWTFRSSQVNFGTAMHEPVGQFHIYLGSREAVFFTGKHSLDICSGIAACTFRLLLVILAQKD